MAARSARSIDTALQDMRVRDNTLDEFEETTPAATEEPYVAIDLNPVDISGYDPFF